MPTYTFVCKLCCGSFETYLTFNEYDSRNTTCECGGYLKNVLYPPTLSIEVEPSTVIHLADRNSHKNMGRIELEDKRASDISAQRFKKPEYAPPPWRPNKPKIDKDLATLNPTQIEKYVATGEKP